MSQQRPAFWQPSNSMPEEQQTPEVKKKFKDGTLTWKKEPIESDQGSAYVPMKSGTLGRVNPIQQVIRDGSQSTGTLRRASVKPNPFVFEPPQSQSTPKVAHPLTSRPGSAKQMGRDQKLTWGRLPPGNGCRSTSAMGQSYTLRPASRQSDAGVAGMSNCVGSRYQSYCTLPRPENLEAESLMELHHRAMYDPYKVHMASRPPSAIPPMMAPAAMIDPYIRPPSTFTAIAAAPTAPAPMLFMTPPRTKAAEYDLINWNTLSTFGSMQVLCSLCIFGLGVTRILQGSKWAIGIELAYSLLVLVAALVGIYAVKRRSYSAATFSYSLTSFNILLSIIPFILGLFPTIPWTFPEVEASWFVRDSEPVELDLCLSLVVFIQALISVVISCSGCRSMGNVCQVLEEVKLQSDMQRAFSNSPIPPKQ